MTLSGPEDGCPERYAACLTVVEAIRLERNLRALRLYAREAVLRCGDASGAGGESTSAEPAHPSTSDGATDAGIDGGL